MAKVCGERYKKLAVTSGGYTFKNPYGLVATPYDYAQWRALAKKLMDLGHDHFETLGKIESELGAFSKWNALVEMNNRLVAHFDNLPSLAYVHLAGALIEEGIAEAQTVVAEALCFLDEVDMAIKSYKRAPPKIPGVVPPAKKPPEVPKPELPFFGEIPWGYVIAGGVVLAGIAAYRRVRD